jgi:hypothetical protein
MQDPAPNPATKAYLVAMEYRNEKLMYKAKVLLFGPKPA